MIDQAAKDQEEQCNRSLRRPTITRGATIQLIAMLNAIWIHNVFAWKEWCNVSKRILQRMGYIMMRRPIAGIAVSQVNVSPHEMLSVPMGIDTPTNFPRCNAGPVSGTKFPRMMPTIMARRIQRARNWSRNPRLLNAELWSTGNGPSTCCSLSFSASCSGGDSTCVIFEFPSMVPMQF